MVSAATRCAARVILKRGQGRLAMLKTVTRRRRGSILCGNLAELSQCLMLTAAELEALRLSLSVALRSVLCQPAAGNRGRLAAHAPGAARAGCSSTRLCICRWCCRRSWSATCCCCCSACAGRSAAGCMSTFGIQLVFTTAGAALATAVMTFPLMVRAIRISLEGVDRGTGGCGAHARRRSVGSLFHRDVAADAARDSRRRRDCVRRGARRVRRGDHVRIEHSGGDAHVAVGAVHGAANARRRCASPRGSRRFPSRSA